ncbi:MAG: biotin carboxylase N-terminal domain-containing protein, partial [Alphaproteobacteria bacterium]
TVAVHSDADARARHVEAADEAVRLGPAPAAESYLRGDRVIEAARLTGADAIHPGYGFLAESAAFARSCADAELIYVGPSADVIDRLGLKGAAKIAAAEAGVPVLPGYNGADQGVARLAREAAAVGFPLAVKAAAGGGGRGLRVVDRPEALAEAIESAGREALAAFGDDRLILERWLARPRHVEVQILGDAHGNVIHLHERDCSVQRRHQKLIEEAPAPGLAPDLRRRITAAAVARAKAVGYQNAGTVEFLLDGDAYFFLEVNTRLQVEHPITEMITGLDLVELQLRIATGAPIGLRQDDVRADGHAIEARVCAEDPTRDFLPQTGVIGVVRWPAAAGAPGLRVDSGIRVGDSVGLAYDSLLGKVIVHGVDRAAARLGLADALAATTIAGLTTNVAFLRAVVTHPVFAAGAPDTGFLGRAMAELAPPATPASDATLTAAALAVVLGRAEAVRTPWAAGRPWRLNAPATETLRFHDGLAERAVVVTHEGNGYRIAVDGREHEGSAVLASDGELALTVDGLRRRAHVTLDDGAITVTLAGSAKRLARVDPLDSTRATAAADGHLRAPMPGRVVKVHVAPGAVVERGQPLVVLEAMKMEHTIAAPTAGRIQSVPFGAGDLVPEGAELVVLEAGET